eukprot:6940872-Ditylum_brightwellii.AAC.2
MSQITNSTVKRTGTDGHPPDQPPNFGPFICSRPILGYQYGLIYLKWVLNVSRLTEREDPP